MDIPLGHTFPLIQEFVTIIGVFLGLIFLLIQELVTIVEVLLGHRLLLVRKILLIQEVLQILGIHWELQVYRFLSVFWVYIRIRFKAIQR
jgi:hypothetical protein